jgi:hypothetical protein
MLFIAMALRMLGLSVEESAAIASETAKALEGRPR